MKHGLVKFTIICLQAVQWLTRSEKFVNMRNDEDEHISISCRDSFCLFSGELEGASASTGL